ncbi:MAG: ribose-phosphate pyrophosphokinase [Gemmatimonadaceae bacterium]
MTDQSSRIAFALPGNETLAASLASSLDAEQGTLTVRHFPDGETYVRIESLVRGRDVVLACTFDRPDDKILPLLFIASTARDLGARRVGLIAPYLAYMRQDRRFKEGEGVTSTHFARLLSASIDWLVTADPHLHRRHSLSEIYTIPAEVVPAAPRVASWIREHVERPLLVGPDGESEPLIRAVALAASAPAVVLEKVRRGDRDVSVSVPDIDLWREHTPVLVDDIISTAHTMIETVRHLAGAGIRPPVCIGVHAVFAAGAYAELSASGPARIVTCDTIPHPSNAIALGPDLCAAAGRLLGIAEDSSCGGRAAVVR